MTETEESVRLQMSNSDVAAYFYKLADALEAKGELRFKVNAYRRAAKAMEQEPRSVAALWQAGELRSISGVGEAIEKKIGEILTTGRLRALDALVKED